MGDENILRYNHNHVYEFGIKQILKGGFSRIGKFNFELIGTSFISIRSFCKVSNEFLDRFLTDFKPVLSKR